jgi:hypothetical protein
MKRGFVMLVCAGLAASACVTPGGSQNSALQAEVQQSASQSRARQGAGNIVLPAVLALPMWPGNSLAPDCAKDLAREACVVIGGGQGETDVDKIRAAYIAVLESKGWQMQWPDDEGPALLRTTSAPQRCVRISFSVWDDGKAARIRLKPIIRFVLDPTEIDCANPGEGPPVITGIPGHRG